LATARYRVGQRTLSAITSSIGFAKNYDEAAADLKVPKSANIHASECPFCGSEHNQVEQAANNLLLAINWLNDELAKSPYRLESFEEQERKFQTELEGIKAEIEIVDAKIMVLDKQTTDLSKKRTQHELAYALLRGNPKTNRH
jgi:DNA repair exonuclease SbcCD ATPase subunit